MSPVSKENIWRLYSYDIKDTPIAPKNIKVKNPAFDVTPNRLITAIITEKGVARKSFEKSLKRMVKEGKII